MSRSVAEWIAAHDDQAIPARVRARVFERCGGICHITGRKIVPGDLWDLDHITPLADGGEHRETNLAPALKDAHIAKTSAENTQRAIERRKRAKHIGAKPPSRNPLPGGKASGWKRTMDGRTVRRDE